jgi:hypothetical protein
MRRFLALPVNTPVAAAAPLPVAASECVRHAPDSGHLRRNATADTVVIIVVSGYVTVLVILLCMGYQATAAIALVYGAIAAAISLAFRARLALRPLS